VLSADSANSSALTQNKAPLYDPLTLTYDAASESVVVEGLTVRAVQSASDAMQLFARACLAATAGTGAKIEVFLVGRIVLTSLCVSLLAG
jgi:hypothetical protein